MIILFLHGWQSTPGGVKPTYLKSHGHTVLNPHLPDDDFDAAVHIVQVEYDRGKADVVVESSRGGAVAMNIDSGDTPLVLLCPAWKTWGTATTVKRNTVILHSRDDDVVPFADSQELVRNSGLPSEALIEVGTEHRLADEESLKAMLRAVEGGGGEDRCVGGGVLQHEAGVPHRFGVGTLLLISTMYAVLFAVWRFIEGPPMVLVWVALFFFAVGLGQMLLFKGQRPRRASIIVGACVYPCMLLGCLAYEQLATGRRPFFPVNILFALFYCIPVGALFGYVAGLLIAAHFLLIDKLKSLRVPSRKRWRKAAEQE
jgi:hypothetical protein